MTTYYVDPVAGSSGNDGLSSGTALSSYFDCYNGALVGGLTNGDIVILMASGPDNYPYYNFGSAGNFTVTDLGSTSDIVQVRAVNPVTLEEDGTKYAIAGNDNQYIARFYGKHNGLAYHNCAIVGKWANYTSGQYVAYLNCIFSDAYGGITMSSCSFGFQANNNEHLFRNCTMIDTGSSSNYNRHSVGDGNYGYSQWGTFDSCEFIGYDAAPLRQFQSVIVNCRFKDCASAIDAINTSNRGRAVFMNNFVDNTSSHACNLDEQSTSYPNEPKVMYFLGNLYNNIGGYAYYYTEATATEVNSRSNTNGQNRADNFQMFGCADIYQNVSSGFQSLPFNDEITLRQHYTVVGSTAASFGVTYDADGSNLMVATGDNVLFNFGPGTSAGLGIFLHSFTEAVVSGSVPEFGDVF